MPEETEMIEVAEPQAAPAVEDKPTREYMREQGWSKDELDRAEKLGMIKPAEKKTDSAKDTEKKDSKPESEAEAKTEAKDTKKPSLPSGEWELTPEQEATFTATFGPGSNPRGLYFRMKNERQARQNAEAKAKELAEEIEAIKARLEQAPQESMDEDPEEKPLTLKQLRQLQIEEARQQEIERSKNNKKAQIIQAAQTRQEEYARSIYNDFDATVELAKDVIKNVETYFKEPWKQDKVIRQIRDLQEAARNADQIDLDQYNAAMIAYEIGQLHPQYGQKPSQAKTGSKDSDPRDGRLTPEQLSRVAENSQRKASSASVPSGSGRRSVSVDDIGLDELNRMSYKELTAFRNKHPDRYAKLMRG